MMRVDLESPMTAVSVRKRRTRDVGSGKWLCEGVDARGYVEGRSI